MKTTALNIFLKKIKTNVSLENNNTFRINGKTKYFFIAKTINDIVWALSASKKLKIPFFILGGGSNVLFSEKIFNGLTIKIENSNFQVKEINLGFKISAGAGTKMADLVSESLKRGFTGLEWAIGLPGTLGGAIYGNAGAFQKSIGEMVKKVKVFDLKNQKIKILSKNDCRFGYRESIFKKNSNLIILESSLFFKKGNKKEIKKEMIKNLNHRKTHQPLNFPSAGSVFKNLEAKKFSFTEHLIFSKFPEFQKFKGKDLIPAGFLIEMAGLKGKKIGDAQISEKNANFIVNLGKAKSTDIKKLIVLIKKQIKKKFGVQIEEEIRYPQE